MKQAHTPREALYFHAFQLATWGSVAFLITIIILLLIYGLPTISWQFLTADWQHQDITKGGIFPALVGSLLLGIGVMIVSFPLGIATALYLTEYNRHPAWRRAIQLAIRNLAGVPSVVYGLFGLAVFVRALQFGMSLLSAALTLSIMTLPWVISASVEALQSVPLRFREASLALGATNWQTIRRITLPSALPGSITGCIIGLARALGETAPIIMVGATFYLSQLPKTVFDPFMALPYHTFILSTQHSSPYAQAYAAGTSLVLIVLTVLLSTGAILLRYRLRQLKDW